MADNLLEIHLDALVGSCTREESSRLARMKRRFAPYFGKISSQLYETLSGNDRAQFVTWFAKRWADINRVPPDTFASYVSESERIRDYPYRSAELAGRAYKILALEPQGYRGELLTYPWMLGVHDFLFNQYEHDDFRIRPGEIIIDAGAFVGDTALLFHQLTGGNCHIHAFEVLEENLTLLDHNLISNGITAQVSICALALSNTSGAQVSIKAPPVQGATSIFGSEEDKLVETITLDDYVKRHQIGRVGLIKMDIEGAERLALEGAIHTIRRDHPRLAICLYHRWDDVIEIPRLIEESGVPYRFGFKWVELRNGWEAVLFATPAASQTA